MNHNWYAVITAKVLMSKQLTSTQKLLIALISNLTNERGYCFATNQYLGECLNLSTDTVSGNISDLVNKRFLGRIIKINERKQVEMRILTIIENGEVSENSPTPIGEESDTPHGIKAEENNKVFNNKENNTIYKANSDFSNFSSIQTKNKIQENPPIAPGPPLPEVERVFLQQGGTREMAEAFFNKHSAMGWAMKGSEIKNFSYLIPSFIINWNKINSNASNGHSNHSQSNGKYTSARDGQIAASERLLAKLREATGRIATNPEA